MTIRDIAKQCHVSVATVSRVLNNDPKGVSMETRQRVLKIIEQVGYKPNAVARTLATKRANIIGLILPDISNPFNAMMAKGVEEEANRYGYNTILCDSDNERDKEAAYIKLLNEHYVAGLIYNNFRNSPLIPSVPFVAIDDDIYTEDGGNGIRIDNRQAMYDITKHMIQQGHRKIAVLTGICNSYATMNRLKGVWDAVYESKIPEEDIIIVDGDYRLESGYSRMDQLLKKPLSMSAVICFNDAMAIGVIQRIKELGMRVPGDIAVSGFDNVRLSNFIHPPLTTVEQPIYYMGQYAAYALIQKLEGNGSIPLNKVFEHKVIYRESTLG